MAPLINAAAKRVCNSTQEYLVLLIITDGVISDMDEVTNCRGVFSFN